MSRYDVRCLEASDLPAWDAMVGASPHATVFDEWRWIQAMAQAAGTDIRLVGVFDGERLVGGVHLQHRERLGMRMARGCRLAPMNSCVVRAPSGMPPVQQERFVIDVTRALAEFLGSRYDAVTIVNSPTFGDVRPFRWLGWRASVLYTYHMDLQSVTSHKFEQALMRADRQGGQGRPVMKDIDDLARFHALLTRASQDRGVAPPISLAQLVCLCEKLPEIVRVRMGAWENGQADVAGAVYVQDRQRSITYAVWGAFEPTRRTPLVASAFTWAELHALHDEGWATFDFVGADVERLLRYKSEFEPRLVPYYQVQRANWRYRIASRILPLA